MAVLFQLPRLKEDLRSKALRLVQPMQTIIGKLFDLGVIRVAKGQKCYTDQIFQTKIYPKKACKSTNLKRELNKIDITGYFWGTNVCLKFYNII